MPYYFSVHSSRRLSVIVFSGDVTADEERAALMEYGQLTGTSPSDDILVDRRHSSLNVTVDDVHQQLDLIDETFERSKDRPKMAIIAPSDFDFGMLRMLQLSGGDELPHDTRIVRNLEDACAWLNISAEDITWPAESDADDNSSGR